MPYSPKKYKKKRKANGDKWLNDWYKFEKKAEKNPFL